MRLFSFILEFLVLLFIVFAYVMMSLQSDVDAEKQRIEAKKSGERDLDRLNKILVEDTVLTDTTALVTDTLVR